MINTMVTGSAPSGGVAAGSPEGPAKGGPIRAARAAGMVVVGSSSVVVGAGSVVVGELVAGAAVVEGAVEVVVVSGGAAVISGSVTEPRAANSTRERATGIQAGDTGRAGATNPSRLPFKSASRAESSDMED